MILKATLRSMASILIYKMDPIFLAFTEKSRSKKATPTYVDILLTCISYNNVLKKICVRHFNDWISIFLPFSFNVVMSFLTYSWEIERTHALWRHQWKPRCLFDPVPDSVQPIKSRGLLYLSQNYKKKISWHFTLAKSFFKILLSFFFSERDHYMTLPQENKTKLNAGLALRQRVDLL